MCIDVAYAMFRFAFIIIIVVCFFGAGDELSIVLRKIFFTHQQQPAHIHRDTHKHTHTQKRPINYSCRQRTHKKFYNKKQRIRKENRYKPGQKTTANVKRVQANENIPIKEEKNKISELQPELPACAKCNQSVKTSDTENIFINYEFLGLWPISRN